MLLFLCVMVALTGLTASALAAPKVLTVTNGSSKVLSIITTNVQITCMNLPITSIATPSLNASMSPTFNIPEHACDVNAAFTLTPTASEAFPGVDVCFEVGRLIE